MFQSHVSFQAATQMFYAMQYEEGLKLIDQCIAKDSKNSILYSNRALFYSQLGLVQEALNDLNLALQLNYLNYIGYFNLFSLLMRCQKFEQAFQNLCCSLSCLYLIRAKTKKSELDASKAIKYAENNMQAHVLKGLIHLQNGKYKLALNQLDWSCEINPGHQVIRNIRNLIFKKMNPGLPINQDQMEHDSLDQRSSFLRLQSSYPFEEQDKEQELRDRIIEFNEIYSNLNEFQGTITTKVPKEMQQNQVNQNISPQQSNRNNQNNGQEQQNQKTQQSSEPIHKEQVQQIQIPNFQSQKPYNQSQSVSLQQSVNDYHVSNQTQIGNTLENRPNNLQDCERNLTEKVAQKLNQQGTVVDGELIFQEYQKITNQNQTREHPNDFSNCSDGFVADNGAATPSRASLAPEPGQYASHSENQYLYESFQGFQSIPDKQNQTENDCIDEFQSMIHSQIDQRKEHDENFDSLIEQNDNKSESEETSTISNSLYPKPQNAMLQFTILKLQLLQKSQQEIAQMENLYCIANYLNSKQGATHPNFKLRTACQKGLKNGTEWNQTFDPIQIPQNPECMKIKVYNKKYSSYRDDLIGQMEVQITTHGLVKLPLFNKTGQLSASILMNLELVFLPIEEVEEKYQN